MRYRISLILSTLINHRFNRFGSLKNYSSVINLEESQRMASPYLTNPITDKETDSGESEKFSFGVASMQGWRDRNEDEHSCILNYSKNCGFFGVYDGHGGPEVSAYTAMKFPKFLQSSDLWHQGKVAEALKEGFVNFDELLTHDDIGEEVKKMVGRKHMKADDDYGPPPMVSGTTICVAITDGVTLYVASAGDSRCVLSRGGSAIELTRDHKPKDFRERRRIKNAGGHISASGRVNYCLNLSRALGDHMMKQNTDLPLKDQAITASPDVRVEKLQTDDEFIVLACDGIWDALDSQGVIDFIRQRLTRGEKLVTICEQLCDACLSLSPANEGGSLDNMTVIIVLLKKGNRPDKLMKLKNEMEK